MMKPEEINNLLRAPGESQAVELKAWLDLKDDADRENIARTLIALRNNDGGILLLGFDDKTRQPITRRRRHDLAVDYPPDTVQRIVKDWVLVPFEVKVEIGERDGQSFPVFTVAPGITTPAITKRGGAKVRQNAVYIRSVQNGVVESTEPRSQEDWDRLFRICFDNREADIARFFQRNLSGIAREVRRLPESGSLIDGWFDEATKHFQAAVTQRAKTKPVLPPEPVGWFEVGVLINGDLRPVSVASLLDALFPHQPHLSGWPIWIDSRQLKPANQPHTNAGGWEALVKLTKENFYTTPLVDFWRLEPGRFYFRRIYEDDLRVSLDATRGKLLDYHLAIERVAEVLAVALAFARERARDPGTATMLVSFRWSKLHGRRFLSWTRPGRDLFVEQTAYQNEAHSQVVVPLAVTRPGLVPFVTQAVAPLFDAFGSNLAQSLGQEIGEKVLRQRNG